MQAQTPQHILNCKYGLEKKKDTIHLEVQQNPTGVLLKVHIRTILYYTNSYYSPKEVPFSFLLQSAYVTPSYAHYRSVSLDLVSLCVRLTSSEIGSIHGTGLK